MSEFVAPYVYTDDEWRRAARTAIAKLGWTQAKVAAKVGNGLTQGMLSHLLSGRTNPSPYVTGLGRLLGIPLPLEQEWLLVGRELIRTDRRLFKVVIEMVRAAAATKRE